MNLKISKARIRRFGEGVFVTKIAPTELTKELLSNNYLGSSKYLHKTQCAFALPKNDFRVVKIRDRFEPSRDIGRIDSSIDLRLTNFYLIVRQ